MVGMAMVDRGGIARRLWIKHRSTSIFAEYSPFFLSLASGTIHSDAFRHFVSQQVHFLKGFAKAYEMAEEYAIDDDDRRAIHGLRKGVMAKLKLHHEWDFKLLEESSLNTEASKYISFLQEVASGKLKGKGFPSIIATPFEKTKLAAYILAAIAPLLRLYAVVSNEIQGVMDPVDSIPIYEKWTETHSSKRFEASALKIETVLDQLSVALTGEELEVIENLYHKAMQLDVNFFSAQPLSQKTIVPLFRELDPAEHQLTLYCDFDMTCTAIDSSAFLAQIAIVEAQKANANVNGPETMTLARMTSINLRNTWATLSSQYSEEYEHLLESIISLSTKEFNYKGLCEALEQFSEFEKRANTRVVQSGVLKGLNVDDIKKAGMRLSLQSGCRGFFQKIAENSKVQIHVLSYCWCGDLIRSAFLSAGLNAVKVHSNELAYEESMTTGEIIHNLESPMEKLHAFNGILKSRGNEEKNTTVVYIGGTVGDLLCLLQADIGIVIGTSLSLRRLGDHFGISFVPLFTGLVKKQKEVPGFCNWKGKSGILYTVSSWDEIHAFILGS